MLVAPVLGLRTSSGRKLEVANRTKAGRYASEYGLIDNPQVEH